MNKIRANKLDHPLSPLIDPSHTLRALFYQNNSATSREDAPLGRVVPTLHLAELADDRAHQGFQW